ncbi:MAG: response regulator [Ignavibacteriaceae bacterium]
MVSIGEETNKTKPRILVAEDDKENQKYLDFILHKTYGIDFCDSPDEFFTQISSNKHNLIVMDITLKGEQSGLSLIRKLKRKEEYREILIVGLSGHVFSQDRKKALEAGADVYLTKPFENKTLMDTLEKLLMQK